jgi:hypothetical protein
VQYRCNEEPCADGSKKDAQTSSDEESEAEQVEEVAEESDDDSVGTMSSVREQQRQCPSGRYLRGTQGGMGAALPATTGPIYSWSRRAWV